MHDLETFLATWADAERDGDAATTARWNVRGTAQGRPIPEVTRLTLITVKDHDD